MKEQIENIIKEVLKNLGMEEKNFSVLHPDDLKNGDYSTNVAMICAKQFKVNPKDLAEKIIKEIQTPSASGIFPLAGGEDSLAKISKIEVAGAGFINFYLSHDFIVDSIKEILDKKENWGNNSSLSGKKIMVEYTQPNPFKPFHIGHLMSNAIGESISRIIEASGAKTIRANYQGDVGPHVAKAFYGMHKMGMPKDMNASASKLAQYIGEAYAVGSEAYDNDAEAKKEIESLNKRIYDKTDKEVNQVYDWGRKVTLEAFEEIYKLLGTKFDYYFFESEMAPIGEKIVRENVGRVFDESDGAIVFHGEKYDPRLHTRVFINSQGLPTYETKEIGLTMAKFDKENLDVSIVTTAIEQAEYMKVVQKAIGIMHPDLEKRMKHITHGMMRLSTGKMSSRKGNVITGESLINDSMDVVREKVKDRDLNDEEKENIAKTVGVSALKYSILRSSLGSDIVYDFEKSISFDGDSGPYLQYTAVRANAIIEKSKNFNTSDKLDLPTEISSLEKTLYQFPEVILSSYQKLEPHHITTYLTKLASVFNTFYGNTKILDKENKCMNYHLNIVKAFYQTMKNGLYLLGIETPEKM